MLGFERKTNDGLDDAKIVMKLCGLLIFARPGNALWTEFQFNYSY